MIIGVIFAGALGVAVADMTPAGVVVTFPSLHTCYAAMALVIDDLNQKHPDKDFAASCGHGPRMTLQELANAVGANL